MAMTRRIAAVSAVAALVVPFAAAIAAAGHPAEASQTGATTSIFAASQTYRVADAAAEPAVVRATFDVTVTPPPAAVVAESAASSESGSTWNPSLAAAVPQTYSGAAVVAYAETFVGVVPYGWGADPSDSFGCDGLVQYVFGHFGISLPRGADNQAALGTVISADEAQAGDLVWWPGRHIGIWDGAGGIIDSPDWGRYVEHHAPWASSGPPIFIRL